ncbi:hypothetical protein OSB04_019734 [Centaurea solstitialis]|uniref:Uncharacterized protein n=1 Tax=Centaurea solstitialis TaxID=347529 RepID=A0AA38WG63_9ASTR|nr:hypothetical protein OSB04_019734 [Centaurea solstitialis]
MILENKQGHLCCPQLTKEERLVNVLAVKNKEIHRNLRSDLVEHIWPLGSGWKLTSLIASLSLSSTMSQETDPSEHPSQGSSEHHSGAPRSLAAVREQDTSSDSDADSHRAPSRSATSVRPYGPETQYGLRGRVTARKSVPLPTQWHFRIPSGDGAGPSRVRGQGGSSSSSSSSSSSPPSSRTRTPPPVARPPPIARPPLVA